MDISNIFNEPTEKKSQLTLQYEPGLREDGSRYPPYYTEWVNFEQHKQIFFQDNLEEFIKLFDTVGFDIFVIACQVGCYKIIKFLIDKNFGLNHITSDKTTGFTFLCEKLHEKRSNRISLNNIYQIW